MLFWWIAIIFNEVILDENSKYSIQSDHSESKSLFTVLNSHSFLVKGLWKTFDVSFTIFSAYFDTVSFTLGMNFEVISPGLASPHWMSIKMRQTIAGKLHFSVAIFTPSKRTLYCEHANEFMTFITAEGDVIT